MLEENVQINLWKNFTQKIKFNPIYATFVNTRVDRACCEYFFDAVDQCPNMLKNYDADENSYFFFTWQKKLRLQKLRIKTMENVFFGATGGVQYEFVP